MTYRDQDGFAQAVMADYRVRQAQSGGVLEMSRKSSEVSRPGLITTGHPQFASLTLGSSSHCNAVAMFIDLENFTGRTFWDSPSEVVNLAHAVLGQVAEVVRSYGGYILGLRGDGLFAAFGPHSIDSRVDGALAMAAGAVALDSVRNALNELLKMSNIEPVQLRVGADFGRLDFVRCGIDEASEINIVGFAANFAAKCEKYANSWEFVIGEGFANLMTETEDWFAEHEDSPKAYQRDYERRTYKYFDVSWTRILPYAASVAPQLDGSSTDAITWR